LSIGNTEAETKIKNPNIRISLRDFDLFVQQIKEIIYISSIVALAQVLPREEIKIKELTPLPFKVWCKLGVQCTSSDD